MTDIATVSNAEATAAAVDAARRGEGVAVLVPCYNEAPTIAKVVSDFRAALPEATIYVYDNNSTDGTADIAAAAGAVVRRESRQGKGNVVRSMFRDIDAEYYLMVDGDDTYPAEAAGDLLAPLAADAADMTVGDRISNGAYGKENERPFHNFGNNLVRRLIRRHLRLRLRGRHDRLPRLHPRLREDDARHERRLPDRDRDLHLGRGPPLAGGRRAHRLPRPARRARRASCPPSPTACSCSRPSRACSATTAPWPSSDGSAWRSPWWGCASGCRWWRSTSAPGYVAKLPSAVLAVALMIVAALSWTAGLILDTVAKSHRRQWEMSVYRVMEADAER